MQLCPQKIQNGADENGIKFSKTKTACVHSRSLSKSHDDPCLHLGRKFRLD